MARNPITFQNGTLVSNAKVEVGGTVYDVTPAQYEGTTPLSANNLNQLQTNLYDYADEKISNEFIENNSIGYSANYINDITTDTYSSNEIKTNKIWIDGKPIYRKVINMGNLNNSTGKTVNHGVSNMDKTVGIMGIADNGSTYILGAGFNDELYWTKTALIWNTKTNRSAFTAYVVLEYTKTTD